jgi:hypothetical protein
MAVISGGPGRASRGTGEEEIAITIEPICALNDR